jgi:beta-galactosidase/beta-glucuronidase
VVAQKSVKASNQAVCILPVSSIKTWSPESPFLYDLVYEVSDKDNKIIDVVNSYVGIRKVHIEGNRVFLNNQPYYQRLVLDQGFYIDGIWTAPTDNDLKKDIEMAMAAGFNGARLHQKVFEERFHYWADKLGYLTWGESSSWGSDYNNPEAARNFISEWSEIILRDRNYPSIITWTPFNETWESDQEQYPRFVQDIYKITKGLDPSRPVNDASGGTHVVTDLWTVHNYEQTPTKLAEILTPNSEGLMFSNDKYKFASYTGQPYLIDEFGGIRWIPTAKDKNSEISWGYGDAPKTLEEYYTRLQGQVDAILSRPNVWGYCFTQLTDVEQEQNGIYLYNRSLKFDIKRIYSIFSKNPSFK